VRLPTTRKVGAPHLASLARLFVSSLFTVPVVSSILVANSWIYDRSILKSHPVGFWILDPEFRTHNPSTRDCSNSCWRCCYPRSLALHPTGKLFELTKLGCMLNIKG
jgi:hypothetical protein